MARTNQGVFKVYKNQFKELQKEFDDCLSIYFAGEIWIGESASFVSSFAYQAEGIYTTAQMLEGNLQGMLQSTKFENAKIEQQYQNLLSQISDIKETIHRKYQDVYAELKYGLTPAENNSIQSFRINI